MNRFQLILSTFLQESLLLGGAIGGGFWFSVHWWKLPISLGGLGLGLGTGAILAGIVIALTKSSVQFMAPLRKNFLFLFQMLKPLKTRDFFLMGILAGLGEETLFRGLIQTGILQSWSWGWGLVIAVLLFGLMHFISMSYVIYTAILGLVFGGLVLITGDLMSAIIAHAVFDIIVLVRGRQWAAEQ